MLEIEGTFYNGSNNEINIFYKLTASKSGQSSSTSNQSGNIIIRSKKEVVLELTHERYKNISNLFGQTLNENPFELYLYGSSLTEEILNVLKKGLSIPVEYAHIDNFPTNEDYKYIEAWGSIL